MAKQDRARLDFPNFAVFLFLPMTDQVCKAKCLEIANETLNVLIIQCYIQ